MEAKKRLLIDNGGQMQCETHAPFKGSDTWRTGRWRPMRMDERADFAAEIGHQPTCETCSAIARRSNAEVSFSVQEFESGNGRNKCAGVFNGDVCVASFHVRDHGASYAQLAQREADRLNAEAAKTKAVTP